MEQVIQRFLAKMQTEYDILGAMLAGSYLTGRMMTNSDIDVFFLWGEEEKSQRGRTYFEGVEFETFFSPEWKYYDRLHKDATARRIYAGGRIILDTNDKLAHIQQAAQAQLSEAMPALILQEKLDLSFQVETIKKDGEDLILAGRKEDFAYFSGRHVPRLCDLQARALGKHPVYEKYAMEQLKVLDPHLTHLVQGLYRAATGEDQLAAWKELCQHLLLQLGDLDIREYQSATTISNKEKA